MDRESKRNAILKFRPGDKVSKYALTSAVDDGDGGVIKDIGRGGTGVVFRAEQLLFEDLSITRAIKFYVLRDDIAELTAPKTSPISATNFIDEIRNLSNVNHQNVIKVIEAGYWRSEEALEVPFVVTDFVNGPTLEYAINENLLKEHYQRNPHFVVDILLQLCRAVRYLHARRFFHCDIAPKNIFLEKITKDCALILGDLGIGRTVSGGDVNSDELIFLPGTKEYSPDDVRERINTFIPLRQFCQFQPRWDLYAVAKTGIKVIESVADLKSLPGYLRAIVRTLERIKNGQEIHSIDGLTERIRILHPAHHTIWEVPELSENSYGTKRWLSPIDGVPVSLRVQPIANHPAVRRLKDVQQLVMASRLFSAGNHDRYEHSLGVYQTMRKYLIALLNDTNFLCFFSPKDVELALVAALLSNITRFPFSTIIHEIHSGNKNLFQDFSRKNILLQLFSIEDHKGRTIPQLVSEMFPYVNHDELIDILVTSHLQHERPAVQFIKRLLNCSIDVRVIDYLRRDAHHMGTSKGDVFDLDEFLRHIRVENGELVILSSGLPLVEQIIASRFWLFNRMYWNRPNRTMIAMLRHALLNLSSIDKFTERLANKILFSSEDSILLFLYEKARNAKLHKVEEICGLLRGRPRLYIELVEYTRSELVASERILCDRVQHASPEKLEALRSSLNKSIQQKYRLGPGVEHILIDFPIEYGPIKLGEDIDVLTYKGTLASLSRISGIVRGVQEGFSEHIQRLRILVHPDTYATLAEHSKAVEQLVKNALHQL